MASEGLGAIRVPGHRRGLQLRALRDVGGMETAHLQITQLALPLRWWYEWLQSRWPAAGR
eukprot:3726185-Prymnesium_polylepis.1